MFARELVNRFGPSEYTDYDEVLTHIRQTGSLRDYQKEFEKLASRVHDWPEKALIGAFVGGLKTELASEVCVFRPRTYSEVVELARIRDDHLMNLRKNNRQDPRKPNPGQYESKIGGNTSAGTSSGTFRGPPAGVKRAIEE